MPYRARYVPQRLLPNIRMVLLAAGLSNAAVSRALNARGAATETSTVSRWKRQVHVPADLRPFSEWSGVPERTLAYGTEAQVAAAIAAAKGRGGMAPRAGELAELAAAV
ncbi:MAG: hypothetical protein EXR31_10490 [Betaproteobacteria bacterium]|nr:hypothetical protein [Betaproteobacteria bacterium]